MSAVFARCLRFFAPQSLRYQLLSRSLFILAGLLLLIGVFQYIFMQQFLYKNKAETMQSQAISLPREAWNRFDRDRDKTGEKENNPPRMDRPMLFVPETTIAYIDAEGNYNLVSEPPNSSGKGPKLSTEAYAELLNSEGKLPYRVLQDSNGEEQLVSFQPVGPRGRPVGLFQLSSSTIPLKNLLFRQLMTFVGLSLVAMIFGLLTFLPVLRRTLVPLFTMVDTMEQIDAGKLNERLPVQQGQLEIDRLSMSFNAMLERLEESFEAEKEAKEQMRRFIADASHELRTPLTSIHGFLEILLRGAASHPDQLEKALKSMYGESERINKLVQDLFMLARLDRTPTFEVKEERLDRMLHDMEPQLRLLAGNRTVAFALQPDLKCHCNQDKIKQVVLNLFQNAIQHTDAQQGHIEVALREDPKSRRIVLSVKDNGPGIPEEHKAHLFDRFYRIETSRARKYGGAGLGLSITKSIVDIHGGTIGVESEVGEGSTFTVRLPQA
ncbi:sensor histidine kinase [Paenibacillus rigui]|uniref:histidine kinase n=1 Tax=Paenibacillus rigui TaxID=554312 RepID=A0A229US26_9BACL|nr:HAMP domain-containing sensor histidine kinase [Paenibacillus rigui]OXM86336.1 two-component sensor histidine kinase [Paenibacillus rigui]